MTARTHIPIVLCLFCLTAAPTSAQESAERMLQSALYKQQVEGDLNGAIELFAAIAENSGGDRASAARALLQLGLAYETLGSPDAQAAYRSLLRDYPDQGETVGQARARLVALGPGDATGPTPRAGDGLVARRIWGDPMAWWLMAGSVSPDGREIAATWWEVNRPGNTGDLIVADAETGAVRVVGETMAGSPDGSTGDTYVGAFAWSRDGARLAYSEWTYGNDPDFLALHVVDADGSNHRVVSSNPLYVETRPRVWSSDGRWLLALVTGWDNVVQIARISMEDGTTTTLKTLRSGFGFWELQAMTLSLSPDDRYVAYAYAPSPNDEPDVHVLAVDGSVETVVAPNSARDLNPLWTPDGSRVVFLSDRSGTADFWAVEMEDGSAAGDPYVVQGGVGPVQPMGYTADGALTYLRSVPRGALRMLDLDNGGALLDTDGPLTERFIGSNKDPVWSPDGTRIAFVSTRSEGLDAVQYLVVKSLEDGSEKDIALTDFAFYANRQTRPQWSADGQSVLFPALHVDRLEAGVDVHAAAYKVDVQTGGVRREAHMWSSQAFLYYVTGRQVDRLRSLGIRIDGFGSIAEAIQDGEETLRPGERLLWMRDLMGWVTDVGCDPERTYAGTVCMRLSGPHTALVEPLLGEPRTADDLGNWRLSPDGGRVAYLLRDESDPSAHNLWVRSVTMDDVPKMLHRGVVRGEVNWTPDGQSVLFTSLASGESTVYRIDVDGGEAEDLHWPLTDRQLMAISLDPTGRRAVLRVGMENPVDEIWALSGFHWDSEGGN